MHHNRVVIHFESSLHRDMNHHARAFNQDMNEIHVGRV